MWASINIPNVATKFVHLRNSDRNIYPKLATQKHHLVFFVMFNDDRKANKIINNTEKSQFKQPLLASICHFPSTGKRRHNIQLPVNPEK